MEALLKLLIYLSLAKGFLASTATFYKHYQDESFCEQSKELENKCASYSFKVLKPLLSMSAECQKKDAQIAELQKQLEETKIKLVITENSLKERENQCKLRIDHAKEMLLSQMEELKGSIQKKDEEIQTLQVKIPQNSMAINNYTLLKSCYDFGDSHGIGLIQLSNDISFPVECVPHYNGFGWMVIQHRFDGKLKFNRNWSEYRHGFGDLGSEYFIGLEKLYWITSSAPHELCILMFDEMSQLPTAHYDNFRIESEESGYKLVSLGKYTGNSGDGMRESENRKFSTFDKDNDECDDLNCSRRYNGGWWFSCCGSSNLNGDNIHWQSFSFPLWVTMLIRPIRS